MAVLGASDRADVAAKFNSGVSQRRENFGALVRADIVAAVNAADDWVVANAASFNAALPVAARNGLTAAQKAALLADVILRRYQTGA